MTAAGAPTMSAAKAVVAHWEAIRMVKGEIEAIMHEHFGRKGES